LSTEQRSAQATVSLMHCLTTGGNKMPKFMDVHSGFNGASEGQIKEAHAKDNELQKQGGVKFEKYWADPEAGKVFCLSEAPNKEAVLRVHEKAGHPTKEIYELKYSG